MKPGLLVLFSFCVSLIHTKVSSNEALTSTTVMSISHHQGKGLGYEQGYRSLKGLYSFSSSKDVISFFDIRGHQFNNGECASNIGFGLRKASAFSENIFGANLYYDYRYARKGAHFNQIGAGLEFLGSCFEARLNVYLPLNRYKLLSQDLYNGYIGGYYILERRFKAPMKGANFEVGFSLFHNKTTDLYLGAGPYYYLTRSLRHDYVLGGECQINLRLFNYISLECHASYDAKFKKRAEASITFNFPLKGDFSLENNEDRISKAVHRHEMIVLDRINQYEWNY